MKDIKNTVKFVSKTYFYISHGLRDIHLQFSNFLQRVISILKMRKSTYKKDTIYRCVLQYIKNLWKSVNDTLTYVSLQGG